MGTVIYLPDTTSGRIINLRRRGRYPKNVIPIWRLQTERCLRDARQRAHDEAIAKAKEQINMARSHATAWEEYLYSIQQEWQRDQG